MAKDTLSDVAVLILRIGLASVFIYFAIDKFANIQANASIISSIGVSLNPVFVTISYGILEILIGTFLLIGLFTRITAGIGAVMLLSTIFTFWLKLQTFLPRDIGLLGAAIFLLINGGGNIGLDRYVRFIM